MPKGNTGKPAKRYHSFKYKAASWEVEEREIAKVEVSNKETNRRYIATDNMDYLTKKLYAIDYCQRGAMELRIKKPLKINYLSGLFSCFVLFL